MIAPQFYDGYRELFARHPQPMWVFEVASLRFLDVNEAAIEAYGYSRERFLDMTAYEIRPDADRRLFFEHVHTASVDRSKPTLWRHRKADGTIFYADVVAQAIDFHGTPAHMVIATDATARLNVTRALSDSRSALAEAQELAHLGSFDVNLSENETRWSAELFRILGVDPAHERTTLLYEFHHPEDAANVRGEIERARTAKTSYTVEYRVIRRDGTVRIVHESGRFTFDPATDLPTRWVGAVLDVTDRKSAESRLRDFAERDSLTGLPNRSVMTMRLSDAIARAERSAMLASVFFIDLDRFKSINDTISHAAGDRLLRAIGKRLVERERPGTIVGRPGGDEFIVIVENLESEGDGLSFAHDLLSTIAKPYADEDGVSIVATASIGVAFHPHDGASAEDLLRAADTAMYAAKAVGGNAVEVYSATMHAKTLADVELERSLRHAIERGAMDVHYQPIVDAVTNRVVALEALVRWTENGRSIPPSDFIPLAEETGLIMQIGTFVLERACQYAAALAVAGFEDITMCVNISTRQFRDLDFAGRVSRALERSRIAPARLQLEITESAYISQSDGERYVRDLADLGVGLSIDDFGTGYSSLGYLKRLPVDALKVDRSFVTDIVTDSADQAIVRAIIAVAKNLGLAIIAEGVETRAQATLLRELGCTQLQGFLFSRPQPMHVVDAFLRRKRT